MDKKHFLKSKTILFNAGIAVLAVLADNIELLHGSVSDSHYLILMALFSGVNVYLRSVTTTGVSINKSKNTGA